MNFGTGYLFIKDQNMKKLVSTFLVLFAVSCTSVKDSGLTKDHPAIAEIASPVSTEEYYLEWESGRDIFVHQNDKKIPVVGKTLIMDNGVIVTPTGRIFLADGRRFQLREGRRMYLNGSRAGEMEPEARAVNK
jgi:hypothetical protein